MRRLLCLWMLFCLLMGISACSDSYRSSQDDVFFYYCRQELTFHESDSVIARESRSKKAIGDDLSTVIHAYLSGPEDPNLTLLFSTKHHTHRYTDSRRHIAYYNQQ